MLLGPGQPPAALHLELGGQGVGLAVVLSLLPLDRAGLPGRRKFGRKSQTTPLQHLVLERELPVQGHGTVGVGPVQLDVGVLVLSILGAEGLRPFDYFFDFGPGTPTPTSGGLDQNALRVGPHVGLGGLEEGVHVKCLARFTRNHNIIVG